MRDASSSIETVAPHVPVEMPATLAPGATVAAEHLGIRGELIAIAGGSATVRSGSVTVRVPLQALRPVAPEILLLGKTTDEARDAVERYLDAAFLAGLSSVRLVHGKGTGALRKAVRDLLGGHPLVDSFREGEPSEGGGGATVAALKVG